MSFGFNSYPRKSLIGTRMPFGGLLCHVPVLFQFLPSKIAYCNPDSCFSPMVLPVFQFLPSKIVNCNWNCIVSHIRACAFQFLPSKIAYCNPLSPIALSGNRTLFQFLPSKIAYCNQTSLPFSWITRKVSIPTLENRLLQHFEWPSPHRFCIVSIPTLENR